MTNKNSSLASISVLSIFFLLMGTATIAPALTIIAEAFPGIPITSIYLITTLPSLVVIPVSIIAGVLAGNKLKYKTLAVTGVLLFVVAGIAPAYTSDFTVILIERAIFGIGFGIITPLASALVIGLYEGDKRAKLLGMGTVLMNLGGILFQFLGGALAAINWNYSFYAHGLGIFSLIMVIFFLPEPTKSDQTAGATKLKVKVPRTVWLTSIVFGIQVTLTMYPIVILMSGFLAANNFGGPATTGIVLSLFTAGGMFGGMVFSSIFKFTKKYVVAVALLIGAVGYVLILFTGNLIMISVGSFIIGAAFALLMPTGFMIVGMVCQPHEVAISTSILMAFINSFVFLSTYWVGLIGSFTGDMIVMPMKVNMILLFIGTLIFTVVNPIPKLNEVSQETE